MFFRGTGGDVQFPGDFGNGFSVKTVHDKNLLALRGKLLDGFFDVFLKFCFHVIFPRELPGDVAFLKDLFLVFVADFELFDVVQATIAHGRK